MASLQFAALLMFFASLVEVHGGEGCYKEFKNTKEIGAAVDKCKTKLGITEADLMMPSDLVKNGFEDKCFWKCAMMEMKYAKDDGTIDLKVMEDDLNKNAPTGKADALLALLKECADTTAKDAVISKQPCKAIAKTKACYMMGQNKICPGA